MKVQEGRAHLETDKNPYLATFSALRPTLTSSQQELLKWVAIITMFIDHVNAIVFSYSYPPLLWIGRIAFPLFSFLIAYNIAVRNVNPRRYVLPLFLFALAAQPIYIWAFDVWRLNILFTFLLGILFGFVQSYLRAYMPQILATSLAVLLFILPSLYVDYDVFGVFLLPILVAFLRVPDPFSFLYVMAGIIAANDFAGYAFYGLLILPLIWLAGRFSLQLKRTIKWFFYVFYPGHLLLLKLFSIWI